MSDEQSPLDDFNGSARLFPLPNVVLFPHAVQPLHIFEPRYREMTADALAGDRLICTVLLQAGWEADYAGQPQVHPVGCLGSIIAEQRLEDGCFNILLRGVRRVRIQDELLGSTPYRVARVSMMSDATAPRPETARKLRRRLLRTVPAWLSARGLASGAGQLRNFIKSDIPVGAVCDLLAFTLPLAITFRQELLEELSVEKRIRRLLRCLQEPAAQRTFPPEFSAN